MINESGNLAGSKSSYRMNVNTSEISVDSSKSPYELMDDLSDDYSDGDDFELEDFSNRRHEVNSLEYDFHVKDMQDESTQNELSEK